MPLFVTTDPTPLHGVFAVEVSPPAVIQATSTGVSVAVGQFPWGPTETLTYPSSPAQFLQTFAPAGMPRNGSAYLSVVHKAFPILGAVRVADPAAVVATATITKTGPTNIITLTASSSGTAGNGLLATVGSADDGNANHFNLTVSVSSSSGTTSETYRNLNISGTGADVLPTLSSSVLLNTTTGFSKLTSGVPTAGNYSFSGGTNGTVTATHYVGTPGGNDFGFALLEGDDTINHVFTDDSSGLRTTVNAGLLAHVELTTDRVGYLNGPSGQSAASAQTDVGNYRSTRICYVDPWVYVSDTTDPTGNTQILTPSASFAASVAAQLPPSASIAWKADFVSSMLAGISSLEANRGSSRGQNTASGITTLTKRKRGGWAFEAGVNTSSTSGQQNLTRTRMGQYIARSTVTSWQPYVDAPNVAFFQQDLVNSLDTFLFQLKKNANINPAFLPYIVDYVIKPIGAANTNASIAAGNFTVATQVQTGSSMSRIFLSMQFGESVVVNAA